MAKDLSLVTMEMMFSAFPLSPVKLCQDSNLHYEPQTSLFRVVKTQWILSRSRDLKPCLRGVMRSGIIAADWCCFSAGCISMCLWLMEKLDPEWLKKAQKQGVVVRACHPSIQEAEGG